MKPSAPRTKKAPSRRKNLYFDFSRLKRCGSNVIIGNAVRIRYPELVEIGEDCIIDDFTYISTALEMEPRVHISAGCKLIGGPRSRVVFGEYSTLAPGVVLSAGSDDYTDGIATPFVPLEFKGDAQIGEIRLGRHCIVGANSVVLPNVAFGDGAAVGALSLVKHDLPEWTLWAGVPARQIKVRDRDRILSLEQQLKGAGND
jgi:acetyltransferase-like isoleucine patch superfamily enzyme